MEDRIEKLEGQVQLLLDTIYQISARYSDLDLIDALNARVNELERNTNSPDYQIAQDALKKAGLNFNRD